MVIAIDFDGTMVKHAYPEIGDNIGAVPVMKRLIETGHKIILYTMRSGLELDQAVDWCKDNNINLYGVNKNPTQDWSDSPKVYAKLYLDDAGFGCPLIFDGSNRPWVDWESVEHSLEEKGWLPRIECEV